MYTCQPMNTFCGRTCSLRLISDNYIDVNVSNVCYVFSLIYFDYFHSSNKCVAVCGQ